MNKILKNQHPSTGSFQQKPVYFMPVTARGSMGKVQKATLDDINA